MNKALSDSIKAVAEATEEKIASFLSCRDGDIASTYQAMLYSTMAGGKRIRPFLCAAVSAMLDGDSETALTFGAALEMVHTYSLIHDDLPCMDNDDFRRGKPTCHKVFGEAEAVLAGDGLLTEAFGLLTTAPCAPATVVEAVRILSRSAGAEGMIGGQTMDMTAEETPITSLEQLEKLCGKKTGALISVAGQLGCLSAGHVNDGVSNAVLTYTQNIGLVFQMIDDYLDVYAEESDLGKPIGSDAANGKTTFMTLMTPTALLQRAEILTQEACQAVSSIEGSEVLVLLAEELLHRIS